VKFSLLTPTKDRPETLQRTIASALAQSYEDWEQIVYDVGDTPATVPDDPRIRYVRGECRGPAQDFQAALDLATGDVVHPLSDDDRLTWWALETVADNIGDADWLYGRTLFIRDGYPVLILGDEFELYRLRRGYYLGGAVYWRKSLTDHIGGFDPTFDGAADYDLYLRMAEHVEPKRLTEILYLYHDHDQTDSRVNMERQADASQRIMERAA
jgi:glycosyltransferase involved in cell wall biosynthesis